MKLFTAFAKWLEVAEKRLDEMAEQLDETTEVKDQKVAQRTKVRKIKCRSTVVIVFR